MNLDKKFNKGKNLFEKGKSQEGADIWMDLAELGHLDAIEQLVYIFLDQRDFDTVDTLIDFAKDPTDPLVLYLKARKIEENAGFEDSIDSYRFAAESKSADACRRLFDHAIFNDDSENGEYYLTKLKEFPEYFANLYVTVSFEDLEQKLGALISHDPNEVGVNQITKISLDVLSPVVKYSRQQQKLSSLTGKAEFESDQGLWDLLIVAADPLSSLEDLRHILAGKEMDAIQLAIYNPTLPIGDAVKYLKNDFEFKCKNQSNFLSNLSEMQFRKKFDFEKSILDLEELKDFKNLLAYMQGENVDSYSNSFEDEVAQFIFDFYIVVTQGGEDRRNILEQMQPDLFKFIQNLIEIKLIQPYIFWTLEQMNFILNRENMLTEHDGQVLLAEDSLFDPGEVSFLLYPEEFKPLESVSDNWIYNIESGMFAVSNRIPSNESDNNNFSSPFAFEAGSGIGDGFYPTIPFFDSFGELQIITTFFTHMVDSDYIDECLDSDSFYRSKLFENRVPIRLGYLKSSSSFFFGDSSWIASGPIPSNLIVQFENLPSDDYLVIAYIDTAIDDGSYWNQRTWAVSLLRDRARRNYEILFELFPELTHER